MSFVFAVLAAPMLSAVPNTHDQSAIRAKSVATPVKEVPMPFRVGEKLDYRVSWSAFSNAASVELSIPERRNLFGWQTWHFRTVAHTLSPVRSLFLVDDQFDSYTDATTLESRQYELHLSEIGKVSDRVLHLGAVGQRTHSPGPTVLVLPGTRDPLGALYALRGVDWQHTPELRAPIYDGFDVYEMRAQRDASDEAVKVEAGSFSASRISIRAFQHEKELSVIHFTIWLANDSTRAPVLIQADLPLGSLRAELTSETK